MPHTGLLISSILSDVIWHLIFHGGVVTQPISCFCSQMGQLKCHTYEMTGPERMLPLCRNEIAFEAPWWTKVFVPPCGCIIPPVCCIITGTRLRIYLQVKWACQERTGWMVWNSLNDIEIKPASWHVSITLCHLKWGESSVFALYLSRSAGDNNQSDTPSAFTS